MTDNTPMVPTEDELMELGHECELDAIEFGRAVLAKWGTPAPVGVEPFAWTDDGSTRSGATATSHRVVTNETKKSMPAAAAVSFTVPLYTADQALAMGRVPLSDKAVEHLICTNHFDPKYQLKESDRTILAWYRLGLRDGERAHGIKKGGQHGADT